MEDLISLARIAENAAPIKRGRGRPRKYMLDFDSPLVRDHIASLIPNTEGKDLLRHSISVKSYDSDEEDSHMVLASLSGMSSDSHLSCSSAPSSPLPSPPQPDYSPKDVEDVTEVKPMKLHASNNRSIGRPRKHADGEDYGEKETRPKKKKRVEETYSDDDSDEAGTTKVAGKIPAQTTSMSVRRVPCFYAACTHSYRRPNSNIVEFSDRPLVLSDKYNGYTIRSCKKHHDWWRNANAADLRVRDFPNTNKSKGSCEICRGLNDSLGPVRSYTNKRNITFNICGTCGYRQADVLGVTVNKDFAVMDTEVITLPGPTRFSPPRAQGSRRSSEAKDKAKADAKTDSGEIIFYNAEDKFSQRVHLALLEKQVDFKMVGFHDAKNLPWLSSKYPDGPIIRYKDRSIYNTDTIIEWLEETVRTGTNILPTDPIKRAEIRSLVAMINSWGPCYKETWIKWSVAIRSKDTQKACEDKMGAFLQKLEEAAEEISENGPYIAGGDFGLADMAVFPFLHGLLASGSFPGFQFPRGGCPRLHLCYEACLNRSSFLQVFSYTDF